MSGPPAIPLVHDPVPSAPVGRGSAPITPRATTSLAQPPISTTSRQRDAAVTREVLALKERLMSAEDDIVALQTMVVELQSRDEASKVEREGLTIQLQQAEALGKRLEAILTTYLSSQGVNLDQLQDATTMSELVVDKKGHDLSSEEAKELSKIYKESLASIYGVTKFSPKEHGSYPKVSNAHAEWPSRNESGRKVPLHRFDFKEDYNSPKNLPSFNAWVDHCLQHGPALSGVHSLPASVLNRRVLVVQCAKYYSSIKRQALSYHGKQKTIIGIKRREDGSSVAEPKQDPESEATLAHLAAIGGNSNLEHQLGGETGILPHNHPVQTGGVANLEQPADSDLEPNKLPSYPSTSHAQVLIQGVAPLAVEANKHNSKGNIRSRRVTKLATREKKRPSLTGDNLKYTQSKYDSYFTIGAMSDEEYVETADEKGNKVVELVTHKYEFASDELIKCRQAIDEIPDPNESSKKLRRRRGSPGPGPPPKAKKAEYGLCSWMVKTDVLAKNPQWFTEGRVYPSGPEWNLNETTPLESTTPKPKKIKLELNPNLQLVQKTQAEWLHAKQEFEKWQSSHVAGNQANDESSDAT